MLRIIQASQLFQYNTTKPMNYLTWNCTITCPVSKHLILYYDGKTNYLYSEKSDGCMNSCIVDNSLVCGIMELYYGFLNYILATILYTLPGAAVVSLLEALTSRSYF